MRPLRLLAALAAAAVSLAAAAAAADPQFLQLLLELAVPQSGAELLLSAGLDTEAELRAATMAGLRGAGMKVGHARKLLAAIEKLPEPKAAVPEEEARELLRTAVHEHQPPPVLPPPPPPPPRPPPPPPPLPPPSPPALPPPSPPQARGHYSLVSGGGGWGVPGEGEAELEAWRKDRRPAGKPASGGGLWGLFGSGDDEEDDAAAGARCPLARVDASSLSPAQFHARYVAAGRPVLLTGIGEDWPAQDLWQKASMLERFGRDITLLAGPPQDLAMWSGAFDGAKRPQSLADYVGRFGNESGRPLYEFAHNPMPSAEEVMAEHTVLDVSGTVYRAPASEHIRGDWQLPALFSHFAEYDNAPEGGRALTTLNIGDHGSGVPPHVHGEAWITAIYGAKKWFLYAPGNLAPPPQLALRRQNQMRK